jgi:hypothetical protein
MTGQAGLTELAAGSVLLLGGTAWTVTAVEAQRGRVMLAAGGEEQWRSIRWLVHHPDCQPVPGDVPVPARLAGQPPALEDLSDYQRKVLWLRVGHLREAETGFRSGDPLRPAPGEPRPAYDPGATTLGQRRRARPALRQPQSRTRHHSDLTRQNNRRSLLAIKTAAGRGTAI